MPATRHRSPDSTELLSPSMYLVVVAGLPMEPVELVPQLRGSTIGRHGDCDVRLPIDAEGVSRFHARIDHHREGGWSLLDLTSRWGTSVNGVRLTPDVAVPLSEGDLIRLGPFTFVFSATPRRRGLMATRDAGQTLVRTIGGGGGTGGAGTNGIVDGMLQLLLTSAEQVHAATDEAMLAERLMDAALRGSGLNNAVVLRPSDGAGHYEIIASRFAAAVAGKPLEFSQSLIQAASGGEAAELSGNAEVGDVSRSIVQMNIASALCVPLMLGAGEHNQPTVAAYLYLDSRGMMATQMRPQARDFCIALGRIASLSLANLKRLDIERRQARLEAEIKSAGKMQAWMLPQRHSTIGPKESPLICIGESRFGQQMGGDFFDLIDLGGGKVAVTIGDVSGKGVAASVIMTATQGYLHAALRGDGLSGGCCPSRAVAATHAFVAPRRPIGKFVTAWVGVIDLVNRTLRYVDAGHGYAVLHKPDGSCETLVGEGGGPPIGLDEELREYAAVEVPFPPGTRLLLMSDGIVEQFGPLTANGSRDQFEVASVIRCLQSTPEDADPVNCLFESLIRHAGTLNLSDDATIVWVKG